MKKIFALMVTFILALVTRGQDSSFYFRTSDSVQLFVRIAGKGKPCLFVHGGPGSTSKYFEAVAASALLEQEMKMIYFDQRGSGRSGSAANQDYSLSRFEKDMEELRAFLNISQWMVMGHSFAGLMITPYAYHYPNSVSALILVNATLHLETSIQNQIAAGLDILGIKDSTSFFGNIHDMMGQFSKVHEALGKKQLSYKMMFRSQNDLELSNAVSASIGNWNRDFASRALFITDYRQDFTVITPHIKIPVLIISGSRDWAIGPKHHLSWKFPNARRSIYEGGHAPFQEDPLWFYQQISTFIQHI
ncbi:alpha/beta fold hydrolase [Flavihumibacter stibioxidans]|nr:alpha/beta hydrolase [Flavihumibacter stibioxidans]